MRFKQLALLKLHLIFILFAATSVTVLGKANTGRVFVFPEIKTVNQYDTFDLYVAIDTVRYLKSYLIDIEVDTGVIKLIEAAREPFFSGSMGAFFFWKDTVQVFPQIGPRFVYEMLSSLYGLETHVDGPGQIARMRFVARQTGISGVMFRNEELLNWHDSTIALRDSSSGLVVVCPTTFRYGDADLSGSIDISDAVFLISYIFIGGPAPFPTVLVADANCSGDIDISDAVYLVSYIFAGGPAPCNPCL
jgi:hypothetical protein